MTFRQLTIMWRARVEYDAGQVAEASEPPPLRIPYDPDILKGLFNRARAT